jgi:putative aldouronate transport system substrate-binding protein
MQKALRIITGVLLVAVLVSALLAGGQQAGGETTTGGTPEDNFNATGFPIVDEKITLTVFAGQPPYVENFDTNWFVTMYEELTNIHVDWEAVPRGSLDEKKNLVFASGDYPDIFLGANLTQDEDMLYGSQGVLIPLNDLIDNYAYNILNAFEEQPWARPVITTPDGNIYSIPQIGRAFHTLYPDKFWINEVWLQNVGMEMPKTTDELYKVLKAFKTQDPNGNGKADEYPLTTQRDESHLNFIMNAFILTDPSHYLVVNDGKVDLVADKPEYRDGIRYLHMLYEEGLLDVEAFTRDNDQLRQIAQNAEGSMVGAFPSLTFGSVTGIRGTSPNAEEYTWVPPIKGPEGEQWAVYEPFQYNNGKFAITMECAYPEAAIRWVDYGFTEEGWIRIKFGEPGVDWDTADEGANGTRGKPAKYKFPENLRKQSQLQNKHMRHVFPVYQTWDMHESFTAEGKETEVILIKATMDYDGYEMPEVYPPVYLTKEQVGEIVHIKTALMDAIEENRARFIVGDLDIEKDWEQYVKSLQAMGRDRYVEIYQQAYDVFRENQ